MKTKNKILTMIKIFTIISISTLLFSCGSKPKLPTNKINKRPYIVVGIEANNNYLCEYNLSTKKHFIYYNNDITITDSIGKYKINDSLYLTLNKW